MAIDLTPGETIRRTKLNEEYGGRRQGGISPSRQTDNVFLITAPEGEKYGYIYDGKGNDGFYYYTGEGQQGRSHHDGNRGRRIIELAHEEKDDQWDGTGDADRTKNASAEERDKARNP